MYLVFQITDDVTANKEIIATFYWCTRPSWKLITPNPATGSSLQIVAAGCSNITSITLTALKFAFNSSEGLISSNCINY